MILLSLVTAIILLVASVLAFESLQTGWTCFYFGCFLMALWCCV